MKNFALFSLVALVFGLNACQKDNSLLEKNMPDSQPSPVATARAATAINYLPLNLVVAVDKKAYKGTWSRTLDLDQDGNTDFTFSIAMYRPQGNDYYQLTHSIAAANSAGGTISVWGPTALSGMPLAWLSLPIALNGSIGPAQSEQFKTPSLPATYFYSYYFGARKGGQIIGKGNKIVGIRFVSNGQTCYGWVRINIPANARKMTIVDAAFNTEPNVAIAAGAI